jgi:hypothetical protein
MQLIIQLVNPTLKNHKSKESWRYSKMNKSILNKDLYGNPEQNPTPTTRLLEERNKLKIENASKYVNNTTVWNLVSAKVLISNLQMVIADLEEQPPEKKFKFSLEVSEQ